MPYQVHSAAWEKVTGGFLWPTGWQFSGPSASLGCNTAALGLWENAHQDSTTGSTARPSCVLKIPDPFIRNTWEVKSSSNCHYYQFSTAWEALSAIFSISLSSRALSLSICSSRPAARVCRSDPGHFICVLISNFLWCVCVRLFPDLTSWICSSLVSFSAALAKTWSSVLSSSSVSGGWIKHGCNVLLHIQQLFSWLCLEKKDFTA